MSLKDQGENKAEEAPLPRSLVRLTSVIAELDEAVRRHQTEQVRGLLDEATKAWQGAQSDNIGLYSRQGDQVNCARYADALNAANHAMGSAQALLMR